MGLPKTSDYGYISDEALLSLDSMEGIHQLPKVVTPAKPSIRWSGYALPAVISGVALAVHVLPFAPFQTGAGLNIRHPVSAAIIAMMGGLLVRTFAPLSIAAVEGAKRVARSVIPATIILTGAGLDLSRIASVGATALIITLLCIALATATALWMGKLLHVWPKTSVLIGAGTAICGTSAIVAVAPLIQAADEDLMLSIGTINILGLVLMFLMPAVGSLLHMKDEVFGVWAGTSIHAVPQVVAAAFAYSPAAASLATLVKLVRVALLAPYMFILGVVSARHGGSSMAIPYSRLIPKFIWGFLGLALLNTFGLFPVLQFQFGSMPLSEVLVNAGEMLLTLSMAAMGLEVNVRFFAKVGGRALLAGTIAALALCTGSLLLIRLLL